MVQFSRGGMLKSDPVQCEPRGRRFTLAGASAMFPNTLDYQWLIAPAGEPVRVNEAQNLL